MRGTQEPGGLILIVEDNRNISEMVGEYLEGRGFEVDYAADGLDGYRLASENTYDVIVLDLMLPRLDGIEGINLQRGQEPDAQVAFIDTIMVNLVGVWNTVHAIAPLMVERDQGGSIVLISSTNGLTGRGGDGSGAVTGYTASKHGVVGIMRSLMIWLAPHGIRINTIHPAGVPTAMVAHEEMQAWFAGNPAGHTMGNAMPVAMLDPIDISRAVLYLVEESGRHITGITLPVDAGFTGK